MKTANPGKRAFQVKPRDDEIIAERKSNREAIRKAYMDALGAQRIPAPTTAGDFLRCFETESRVVELQETLSVARDLVSTWAYMVIASLAWSLKPTHTKPTRKRPKRQRRGLSFQLTGFSKERSLGPPLPCILGGFRCETRELTGFACLRSSVRHPPPHPRPV